MKILPLRLRLTLWYFCMFATAACLLSAASWWMLRRSLDSTEYHELQERAEDVQELLNHRSPDESLDELRQEFTSIYSLKDDGKWLQVMDQEGNWIYRSKRIVAEYPAVTPPDKLPREGRIDEFHQGTRYVRALTYPIEAGGKRYAVQTGIALNKSMVLLQTFGTDLLLLTPAVILLAAFGGHWMSRKALRPVAVLATEARRINDRNLDIRLPVHQANDEIADLSKTLNQMLERIDKAFASVRAFTGNASHELRTPIALMRTEIEVALYRPRESQEYRETLNRLHEESIRMTNLVDNFLSLARADGGAEIFSFIPVPLATLFEQLDRSWRNAMEIALIDFRVDLQMPDLEVLGEPTSLVRLLSILLDNASKYTPAGGMVTLSAIELDQTILLSVRDTGIGVASEDLPRIFDRFYRATNRGASNPRGSGLGLALAKWIAERHRTQLAAESAYGTGSCFSFRLFKPSKSLSASSVLTTSASD